MRPPTCKCDQMQNCAVGGETIYSLSAIVYNPNDYYVLWKVKQRGIKPDENKMLTGRKLEAGVRSWTFQTEIFFDLLFEKSGRSALRVRPTILTCWDVHITSGVSCTPCKFIIMLVINDGGFNEPVSPAFTSKSKIKIKFTYRVANPPGSCGRHPDVRSISRLQPDVAIELISPGTHRTWCCNIFH